MRRWAANTIFFKTETYVNLDPLTSCGEMQFRGLPLNEDNDSILSFSEIVLSDHLK